MTFKSGDMDDLSLLRLAAGVVCVVFVLGLLFERVFFFKFFSILFASMSSFISSRSTSFSSLNPTS